MLPGESEVAAEIKVRYEKELTAMTALHDAVVGMVIADQWTIRRNTGAKPFTIEILLGRLTKACKTFRSIQVLCERGLYEDANALVRVLLETTIAVVWILQRRARDKAGVLTPTSHQRAIAFLGYSLHQQLTMLKEWKKTKGLKRLAPKRAIEAVEKQIVDIKTMLPSGMNFEKHWSGKGGLQQTVTALKADSLYSVLFRHTSSISHASDVGLHFEPHPATGEPIWQIAPRAEGVLNASLVARELLWMLANRIDERLGLGFSSTLARHRLRKADVPSRAA